MKFMNQQARNWANHYQEEAGAGGEDLGGGGETETTQETTETETTEITETTTETETTETDDWRSEYLTDTDPDGNKLSAKDLKKRKNILDRFTDKNQFAKSYFDLHGQVRSAKPVELPEDATDEQKAEYRKSVGLPESVDKYEYELSEGLVLGAEDQAITDGLKEIALENNIPPKAMSAIIEGNLKLREVQMKERENRDSMLVETSSKALEERWGTDMPHNINAIDNTFNALPGGDDPEGIRMQFQNARMPNGDRIFDNPDTMNLFASLARKANPESVLSNNDGGGIGGRMQEIEAKMEKGEKLTTEERNEWARLEDLKTGKMQDNKPKENG